MGVQPCDRFPNMPDLRDTCITPTAGLTDKNMAELLLSRHLTDMGYICVSHLDNDKQTGVNKPGTMPIFSSQPVADQQG